jgi:hypothetical protein
MTNQLTEKLLAEGHTRESFPDYVQVGGGYELTFKYAFAHLCKMVWETPCGLMRKGGHWLVGSTSYLGVTYSAENDNPLGGCPHYDKTPCPHRVAWAAERGFWGETCVFHEARRPYDYGKSIEKFDDEARETERAAREKMRAENPQALMCQNCRWDEREQRYKKRYDLDACVRMPCQNSVCAITREPFDKEQVYIVYDTRKSYLTKEGLFEETREEIIKGIKVFKNSCDRTIAELWIKANAGEVAPKLTPDERRWLHYQSIGEQNPRFYRLPAGYSKFEIKAAVQNLRIKKKGASGRDLAQDLADIAEGIAVTHESDQLKAAAALKRERKEKRQVQRRRKAVKAGKARALAAIAEKGLGGLDNLERWLAKKFLTPEEAEAAARPQGGSKQLMLFDGEAG